MPKTKAGKKIVEARAHIRRTKKGKKLKSANTEDQLQTIAVNVGRC